MQRPLQLVCAPSPSPLSQQFWMPCARRVWRKRRVAKNGVAKGLRVRQRPAECKHIFLAQLAQSSAGLLEVSASEDQQWTNCFPSQSVRAGTLAHAQTRRPVPLREADLWLCCSDPVPMWYLTARLIGLVFTRCWNRLVCCLRLVEFYPALIYQAYLEVKVCLEARTIVLRGFQEDLGIQDTSC